MTNSDAAFRFDITVDNSRDNLLTDFGKATLADRYLLPRETPQQLFARVACAFADDKQHAQRLYDYMSKLWFMPATPILANGGTKRGLPISCYLNEVDDSLTGIVDTWNENVWLASRGGGIGTYWGNVRGIGAKVSMNGGTSGIMPFVKVMDSMTLAISQGSLRRGSAATYIPIDHPEIEEFIEMRRPTGGDPNRRSLNLHHGVVVSDAFMRAVESDGEWKLVQPHNKEVVKTISARALWVRILTARIETGEPYLLFIDAVNNAIPIHHEMLGLRVKTSNLCSEITLPTGRDHLGQDRTAVCCLSSLNLDTYLAWSKEPQFIEDVLRFLDNVLQYFIDNAPDTMARARYSAMRERSVGLGVMGFHSFLQAQGVPFGSISAIGWNKTIFRRINNYVNTANKKLALERGACPDAADAEHELRFSNATAVAPTASISIICGGASPGIEPVVANVFNHKTLSGSFAVRNPNLKKVLAKYGQDNPDTWASIATNGGSVQHLDFLNDHEKEVYRTAFELDQRWIVDHAADRTPYIHQAQSVNLFFPADVSKRDLNSVHLRAWQKGLKSLYYCRSVSVQRAETVRERVTTARTASLKNFETNPNSGEECLVCQ